VFDEFDGLVLTGLTFKSAFLDPRLVRLDAREPHRCAAFGAGDGPRLSGAPSEADARPLRVCNCGQNLREKRNFTIAFDRAVLAFPLIPLPHTNLAARGILTGLPLHTR
jgi:hypothetical protein